VYTTIEQYASAADVSEATASRRLKGETYRIPTKARGRRYYHLAAAVQTLKRREIDAGAVCTLVQAAVRLDDDLYIGPEALSLAREFADWLPEPVMRDRLRMAQNAFVVAVANSRLCTPAIVQNLGPLRELFVLCPPVLSWVLIGGTPPDIDHIAPAFAVANNSPSLGLYTEQMKEAA